MLVQAFAIDTAASAKSRDEFPGRRQGGGTHWVAPTIPNPTAPSLSVATAH